MQYAKKNNCDSLAELPGRVKTVKILGIKKTQVLFGIENILFL